MKGQKKPVAQFQELFFRKAQANDWDRMVTSLKLAADHSDSGSKSASAMKQNRTKVAETSLLVSNIPIGLTGEELAQIFGDVTSVRHVHLARYCVAPLVLPSVDDPTSSNGKSDAKNIAASQSLLPGKKSKSDNGATPTTQLEEQGAVSRSSGLTGGWSAGQAGLATVVRDAQWAIIQFRSAQQLNDAMSVSVDPKMLAQYEASVEAAAAARPVLPEAHLTTALAAVEALNRSFDTKNDPGSSSATASSTSFERSGALRDLLSDTGLGRWAQLYDGARPDPNEWQDALTRWLARFDRAELAKARARDQAAQRMDADGFVVVQGRGRKRQRAEGGVVVSGAPMRAAEAAHKRQKQSDRQDFYQFQRRQRQSDELHRLQAQFDLDKRRIARIHQERKFKPL